MVGQGSEDVQPNEVRLNRKGVSNVPLVRVAHARGGFRGARGRGFRGGLSYNFGRPGPSESRGPRAPHPPSVWASTRTPQDSGPNLSGPRLPCSTGVETQHDTFPSLDSIRKLGVQAQARYRPSSAITPSYSSNQMVSVQPQKRAKSPVDIPQRPVKLARVGQIEQPDSGGLVQRSSNFKKRHRRKVEVQTLLINLPKDCRKGEPSCKQFRAQWIREKLPAIAAERGIKIISYSYLDDSVRLEYVPLDGSLLGMYEAS